MRILIYDDNPDFGGHQIMACHGIEALANHAAVDLICMINPANGKLTERLADFNCIAPASDFNALRVDQILCIQGDLSQSTQGILNAKKAGINCVSYLALPHSLADMGAKFGALRDRINQRFINMPDRYITIAESMKQRLLERGCKKPVHLVPNGIPSPGPFSKKTEPPFTIGMIGRIEISQKQHDFMVRTFLNHPAVFGNCRLLIAGSGPDRGKLEKMIAGKEHIQCLPWQTSRDALYEKIDLLAIPSRYEGVPLVMLEALSRGIPVIGAACDGMKDTLPAAWTFESENQHALIEAFSIARKSEPDEVEPLRQQVLANHSLEAFKTNFVQAVLEQ